MENEITLKINCEIDEFYRILESRGFERVRRFDLFDTYFISNDIELEKLSVREILEKAVLLRDITDYDPFVKTFKLTSKFKEFDKNGNILFQRKVDCIIENLEEGRGFIESIGYKNLMQINERDVVFGKEGFEIAVKDIENGEKLIEVEIIENDERYNSVSKLEEKLRLLDLPLDMSNFFVKKAEVELKKKILQ